MQHYQRLKKMEEVSAEPFANLLAAAKSAANKTTATSYSDAPGTQDRRVVYIALYDADADPFVLIDPNTDLDFDLYTGSTANLLWIRVETEGTAQGIETLGGESLFLRKLVLGIPAQASGKNLTRPLMPAAPQPSCSSRFMPNKAHKTCLD